MKKLAAIFSVVVMSSCLGGICEEPQADGFFMIRFRVVEGTQDVFSTEDARQSLQLTSVERNQPVTASFTESTFFIDDASYDVMSIDDLICPSYILKYRTNDVDTLKVCYQLEVDKCKGTHLHDVKVFWNQKAMDYSNLIATITK